MNADPGISIRPTTRADKEFVISLVPRLTEFGPPPWRDADRMTDTDARVLSDKLELEPTGTAIFIAEDTITGTPLGFIHLKEGSDHYNKEEHGHIEDIIVAPGGEGRGVGRALMAKAEEWAREQNYRWLTLSVFGQNVRAKALYERLGYGEDIIRYVKELI